MSLHVVISHGEDFFGQDRYRLQDLHEVARYAEGCLPAAEHKDLVRLLDHAGTADHEMPASQAAAMADLLRRVARSRYTRPKAATRAAALANAASRAAADSEPWTWTPTAA